MRDPKSLAAEVEAIINRCVRGTLTTKAAADRITAIESRAFEDGERSMRQRAEAAARAWMMPELPLGAYADGAERISARVQARNKTVAGIAAGIAALQPEGEQNA